MIISKMLFVSVLVMLRSDLLLKVIHVRVLMKNSHNRNNKRTNVYVYIFDTKCVRTPTYFELPIPFSASYLTSIKPLPKHRKPI